MTQVLAALGVAFMCVVVGVPLWWKTTTVYRVQLPYSEIADLNTSRVSYIITHGYLNGYKHSIHALHSYLQAALFVCENK